MTRKDEIKLDASEVMVDPYLRLAAAVVTQAAQNAMQGDSHAAAWLTSEIGLLFCAAIGLDVRRVRILATNWNQGTKVRTPKVTWRISLNPQVMTC
jgi:shikimate kinase